MSTPTTRARAKTLTLAFQLSGAAALAAGRKVSLDLAAGVLAQGAPGDGADGA